MLNECQNYNHMDILGHIHDVHEISFTSVLMNFLSFSDKVQLYNTVMDMNPCLFVNLIISNDSTTHGL